MKSVPVKVALAVVIGLVLVASNLAAMSPDRNDSSQQQQPKPRPPADQDRPPAGQDDTPLRIGTDLVVLDVTVVDQSNKPIMDLSQDKFQVFEDKVPQKIEFFTKEQVPVSLVFAIDTSGSMRSKLETVIKASTNLIRETKQGDEIAVIEFKEEPVLLEEFTTDVNDAIYALEGMVARSQTAMLDALYLAAEYGHKEGKNRRKAVIVVTDGEDKDSQYQMKEVIEHLQELDVQVYLIGFTNDLDKSGGWVFSKSPKEKAENLLNKLALETGGRAFFPRELSEVHTIAQQISADLRAQYSIGYYPSNSKRDGTFRTVRVQVEGGPRKLVARTRNGYTSPRENEQPNTVNR
ncbi:MAG TPA: VWA domain-containing protein [Blastocatellia bacterium]|nr:VWA domain-containing protein [Blastocatellia bacterium]